MTVRAFLAACDSDIVSMRDAALISLAYDAGLRVSELVGTKVGDLRQVGDMSGRLEIAHSKTDQEGPGGIGVVVPRHHEQAVDLAARQWDRRRPGVKAHQSVVEAGRR